MLKFNLEQQLKAIIGEFAFSKGLKEEIVFSVEIPPKNINADLALNAAMVIAKKIKTNPRIIAQELSDIIISKLQSSVKSAEIAGAGFINLYFTDSFLQEELKKILEKKEKMSQGTVRLCEMSPCIQ